MLKQCVMCLASCELTYMDVYVSSIAKIFYMMIIHLHDDNTVCYGSPVLVKIDMCET